jgi:glycosyltransferase involved in cell wall biosynthesis
LLDTHCKDTPLKNSKHAMPNALMLCFYFPPVGGPGTQRSAKFVKYLPGCGWTPVVIGAEFAGEHQDPTLMGDIPPEAVIRRVPFPQTRWRRCRDWSMGRRLLGLGLGRLAIWGGYFKDFPDTMREWSEQAVLAGQDLHRQHRADVLYTTSYPYSSHLAGAVLKRRLGIPWVADLRDPWIENEIMLGMLPGWVRRRHRRAEARMAREADALICAHPGHAERLRQRYDLATDRCLSITNGYDPEDYRGFPDMPPCTDGVVRIAHVGSFYGAYSPRPLFAALKSCWPGLPAGVARVRLQFVGGVGDETPPAIDGLDIEVLPRASHAEALAAQAGAHALLCVFDRAAGVTHLPGKLFEYLAASRPILGVLPADGTMAQIIQDTSSGVVADCDRPEEIVQKLLALCKDVSTGQWYLAPARRDRVEQYSRPFLTQRLAEVFERVRM